jgi:hypothetical protein
MMPQRTGAPTKCQIKFPIAQPADGIDAALAPKLRHAQVASSLMNRSHSILIRTLRPRDPCQGR